MSRGLLDEIIIEDGVTAISEFAFLNCFFLKEITLPNSLKSIGRGAFYGCRSLEGIVLPEGITEIKSELSHVKSDIKEITERLIVAEQSVKMAHKRLNELHDKGEKS